MTLLFVLPLSLLLMMLFLNVNFSMKTLKKSGQFRLTAWQIWEP